MRLWSPLLFKIAVFLVLCYRSADTQDTIDTMCANTTGAIFEVLSQSCFLTAGTPCDRDRHNPPFPCLPNSDCITDVETGEDVCACLQDLTPNVDGHCFLRFEDECSVTRDLCNPTQHLSCSQVTGRCDCSERAYFEVERNGRLGMCVLRAGASCGRDKQRCGANADCSPSLDQLNLFCSCQGQNVTSEDGRCLAPHGRSCNYGECQSPFVCDVSHDPALCTCPHGSKYDLNTDTCFIIANQACTVKDVNTGTDIGSDPRLECTPNSDCSARSKKCLCTPPLKATATGSCFLGHGDDCEDNFACDPHIGLVCLHSVCECPYGAFFHDGRCKMRAGLPCDGQTGSTDSICVPNAECLPFGGQWTCVCVNGTSPNSERLCYAKRGEKCDEHEMSPEIETPVTCDPVQHLSCISDLCTCVESMEYVHDGTGCRLVEGAECILPVPACIPNATCVDKTCECGPGLEGRVCEPSFGSRCAVPGVGGLPTKECVSNMECIGGVCLCPAGFNHVPLENGLGSDGEPQCFPGLKMPCLNEGTSAEDRTCSPTLTCDRATELCVCAHPHQMYGPSPADGTRCVSPVGSLCTVNTESEVVPMFCTSNANCIPTPSSETLQNTDEPRYGLCECAGNYTATFNQTCALPSSGGIKSISTSAVFFALSSLVYQFLQ